MNEGCSGWELSRSARLVCQAMPGDPSECQGCTGSTSITCVHSAVARNSFTYFTALETPDRSEMGHQSQGTAPEESRENTNRGSPRGVQRGHKQGQDSQAAPQESREDTKRQLSLALSTGLQTRGSKSRGSCARLYLGFPAGLCNSAITTGGPSIYRRF